MNIATSNEPVEAPVRGRPSFDYSVFGTEAVVKIEDEDYERVRIKANNLVAGARIRGYTVKSHVICRDDTYIGFVTRRE